MGIIVERQTMSGDCIHVDMAMIEEEGEKRQRAGLAPDFR
jgi:hypothetical protein